MAGDEWVSLRAYARHRGDSLPAVQKAIKSGRIRDEYVRRDADGRLCGVNVAGADADWARHTDPDEAMRNGKVPGLPVDAPAAPAQSAPPVATEADEYLANRAVKEKFLAEGARLDYMERVGTLVPADAVRAEQFTAFRELRDSLEQLAPRVSQKLASETDPQRIEHVLRDEMRRVLANVSKQFSADDRAAAGLDVRAAAGA